MSLILHTYSDPNGTVRDSFVKPLENNTANKTRPYYDGSIAIGYGFDLLVRTDADINKYLTTTNTKLNLPVNQQISLPGTDTPLLIQARGYAIQIASLKLQAQTATPQQLIIINQQISSLQQQIYNNSQLLSLRLPDEPYAAKLLNILLNDYETALDEALGYCLAKSKEKTAILSHLYTMTNPSATAIRNTIPSTLAAIENDNRAEAWYEIRYRSNVGGGHTERRYKEANEFGLYNYGVLSTDEQTEQAKEIMRMYTRYEYEGLGTITLSAYELPSKYPPPSGIQNINDSIKPANDYLVLNYAMGQTIDGWVIVGRGLDSYNYKENGNWADNIIGTNKNDLIFGEKGSDVIDGSTGDDTIDGGDGDDTIWGEDGIDNIYGGNDNDTMYGDKGDDILMGEEGVDFLYGGDDNDILIGGKGSDVLNGDAGDDTLDGFTDDESAIDVLKGGTGNDIYWTGGDDVIIDEDGLGSIYYGPNQILLTAGERKETDPKNTYVSILDKNVTYRVDGPGKLTAFTPDGTINITSQTGAGFVVPLLDDGTYDTNYVAPLNLPMYGPNDDKHRPDKADTSGKEEERDPLILDLDGNGIHTVGLNAGTHFDHDGNGFKELTGWAGPGSGMLMLDRNADGSLDSGSELFGSFTQLANGMYTANGFEALAQFDTNDDGKIDNSDPIWSQLKVWQYDPEGGNRCHILNSE